MRFGSLVAKEPMRNKDNVASWLCVCDCGNTAIVPTNYLTSGNTKSCGCGKSKGLKYPVKGVVKGPRISMIGKKFGRLTVIKQADHVCGEQYRYICKCDCGNVITTLGYSLRSGETKSCGCYAREVRVRIGESSKGRESKRALDLKGKRFEYLFVLDRCGSNKQGKALWKCLCNCGNTSIVTSEKLRSGRTVSCGCLGLKRATEAKIIHGMAHTPLYCVLRTMRARCENPKSKQYKWYGAKGIKVCDEWKNSFEQFYAWAVSNGYEKGLTIDRIDPEKDYCPENCRWITRSENSRRVVHKK